MKLIHLNFHSPSGLHCPPHCARAAPGAGDADPGLTAGEWALVVLLSMTKSLTEQQAARAVNSELGCFLSCPWEVCLWLWSCMCSPQHTYGGTASHLPYLPPPTLTFPLPPHKAFRVSPKAFYPPICSKTSAFFSPSSSSQLLLWS